MNDTSHPPVAGAAIALEPRVVASFVEGDHVVSLFHHL
jgi:hypothetical protein